MKKLKLISTILLISLLAALFIMPTAALEDPVPEANSVVLMDIETGNLLYSKNGDGQAAPASLTKVMTVMLAIEEIELGLASPYDNVTAIESMTYDLIEDGSTAGIKVGETMTLEDLLYCAMLKSANEACNIIAEHITGNINQFVARMNAKAIELGCKGTNFVNTHGLPAANHYTTAADMALIARAALSHPMFVEIVKTPTKTIPATNVEESRLLENTNGLVNSNSTAYPGYYYEYAYGVKTGYTEAAGYCLVSAAKKNGVNLLCVVMGGKATATADGTKFGNFTDTINIYNWAFENYSYRDILKVTDLIDEVPVEMGSGADFVSVHPQSAVRALLPNDDDLQSFVHKITIYSEESGESLVAPVEAGQVLGEISIIRDGVTYGSSPLVATSSIDLNYSKYISERISAALKKPAVVIAIMVILLLIAVYVFLVVRYRKSRREYIRNNPASVPALQKANRADKRAGKPASTEQKRTLAQQLASRTETKPQVTTFKPVEEPVSLTPDEQAEKDYFEDFFGKK